MASIQKAKRGRGSGEVVFKILDTLADVAFSQAAMIGAILETDYGARHGEILRAHDRIISDSPRIADREARRREYQRYAIIVRYLREQGMLSRKTSGETIKLYLTKKGREKLARMRLERRENISGYGYDRSPGKKVVIVTYDIPEKRRTERDWLRAILKRIGLTPMQQSVWIGKVAIPQRLIEDLALRHLTSCVEIVEVGSTGTFQHLL